MSGASTQNRAVSPLETFPPDVIEAGSERRTDS
jgi:hypothetical protein